MLEFGLLMIVIMLLSKWKVGVKVLVEDAEPAPEKKPGKAYVMGNTAEYDFKSLDDAMEFREMRLTGWKGNAIDYYKWKEEA